MSDFINTIDVLGDDVVIDSIIDRSITEFKDDKITKVGAYAFNGCSKLATFDAPNMTSIGAGAFMNCSTLDAIDVSKVTSIPSEGAFNGCTNITMLDFPSIVGAITIMLKGIGSCGNGKTYLKLPNVTGVGYYGIVNFSPNVADFSSTVSFAGEAFGYGVCGYLVLRSETMCTAKGAPFSGGIKNYIFVPRALVEEYKVATNWSTYADQFRALEDYTVDGTTTGEFVRCTGVTLDQTSLTFDELSSQTLTATLLTPSPLGFDTVTWKSADESIATVADGVVIPVAKGSTTITATCNGYSATCEVVVNVEGALVMCEVGGIGYQIGDEQTSTTRFRTEAIPFVHSNNTFRADVVVNGNTSSTARLLLRPYKADGTFDTTNFAAAITPSAVSNWALSGTDYTINFSSDVAYVRAVFTPNPEADVSSINGTITVSGITYKLVQGG